MNSWNLTGNLGRDAEQRFTQNGDSVVSFSVGVKAGYGDKATTTWARCSMFGKRGEAVAPYLTKGQLVGITGELSAREWTDKQGLARTSIEVRVNDLTLLGKRDAEPTHKQTPQQHQARPASPKPVPQQEPATSFDDMSSDIPF